MSNQPNSSLSDQKLVVENPDIYSTVASTYSTVSQQSIIDHDGLISSIYDDASSKLEDEIDFIKLENSKEDTSESASNEQASNELVNFKLGQKDFDENELDREQEEQISLKQKYSSDRPGSEEGSSDEEEFVQLTDNDEWKSKSKHIFILSESGKAIYSLHGSETKLVSFMGLLQALVSIIECDNQNMLDHVIAGDHKIVFLHKSHLIFVCVSNEVDKGVEQLGIELEYVYNQIISIVTLSLIEKIFGRHPNYDLRNKLTGTEKLVTNIIKRFNNDYGMLLNCVNSYPLRFETRDQIARMIAQQISSIKYVLFGLLMFDNKLVTLIRPKTKNIHPVDVHLLVNVITGLDTAKTSEFIWYPICLPNFDSSGLMYAYISHLDDQCKTCLIFLTGLCNDDQSSELNECRKRIQQKLQAQNMNQILNIRHKDNSLRLEQIGVSELKHFLFKDNKIFQYFVSDYALPYSKDPEQQQRIFDIYQKLYHKLHNPTNTLRIIYIQQKYETVLGWLTSSFEIYATFSPLITKEKAVSAINKLLDFTQKNKQKIFLSSMPTLQR